MSKLTELFEECVETQANENEAIAIFLLRAAKETEATMNECRQCTKFFSPDKDQDVNKRQNFSNRFVQPLKAALAAAIYKSINEEDPTEDQVKSIVGRSTPEDKDLLKIRNQVAEKLPRRSRTTANAIDLTSLVSGFVNK